MQYIMVIGVSGSGKSTIASALASRLGGTCLDADDFHPSANIEKMSNGIPLTDEDRRPWLQAVAKAAQAKENDRPVVIACSALKRQYRKILHETLPGLRLVYLKGTFEEILERMEKRSGHFMKPSMLRSQFADLEEPQNALIANIGLPVERILDEILAALPGKTSSKGED